MSYNARLNFCSVFPRNKKPYHIKFTTTTPEKPAPVSQHVDERSFLVLAFSPSHASTDFLVLSFL